jgi:hypothetical protein
LNYNSDWGLGLSLVSALQLFVRPVAGRYSHQRGVTFCRCKEHPDDSSKHLDSEANEEQNPEAVCIAE